MIKLNLKVPDDYLHEETICDFVVSKSCKELWAVELDLLNEFDRVCKANNLRYWADSGTLLGAIRHKGFIPWDDDIDVVMMREDYTKLCSLASEFKSPYFFQTEETDPYSLRGHAQLRNSLTTGILKDELDYCLPFNQGIFIDIFPLDYIPDDDIECERFIKKLNSCSHFLYIMKQLTIRYKRTSGIKGIIKHLLYLLFKPFQKVLLESIYKKRNDLMTTYHDTKRVMKLFFFPTAITPKMQSSYFRDTESADFEFLSIPVPSEYDEVLKTFYGDWKTPKTGMAFHSGIVVDTNTSYTEYLNNIKQKTLHEQAPVKHQKHIRKRF